MGEVVVMPGIERRDLVGNPEPADRVLRRALDLGITDLIIVGRRRDGSRFLAGSFNDLDKVVGVLMDGINHVQSHDFIDGIPAEPFEPYEPS